MSSDLLSIASSGIYAARTALDVTAQNIANAATEGYVRRGVQISELAGPGTSGSISDVSLFGVRPPSITRNVDAFRQAEMRRTGADAARADAQVTALTDSQSALEQSNLYPAITQFTAALSKLVSNPTDSTLRASVVANAGTMAQSFNLAAQSLASVGSGLTFQATDGTAQINLLATNLAQVNLKIASDTDPAANQSVLLDQRDMLLQNLSKYCDITTTIAADNTVKVQMGGSAGPLLVSGTSAAALAMTSAANGTLSFTLGGAPVTIAGGSLAGQAQALSSLATTKASLDLIATGLISAANTAQASGVALDGTAGPPLLAGTSAATIAVALTSGAQLATAPAGAGAGSRDPAGLTTLQNALITAGTASGTNALLFSVSSQVQSATITQTAIDAIAANAKTTLEAQSGVNMDTEAGNLLRFQQAFQASGKVIQIASTLFNQLLQIP